MSTLRALTCTALCSVKCLGGSQIITARSAKRWLAPTLKELERRRKKILPKPDNPRSSFLEWDYRAEWFAFGKRLSEEFKESSLQCAFTHHSYVVKEEKLQREAGIENPEIKIEDNRVLIDEGHIFINNYVRRYVPLILPRFPEEGISAVCDYLLQEEQLANVSKNIGTKDLILSADIPPEQETLALTLKAIVGALIESSGPERAGLFIRDFIMTQLIQKDVNDIWHPEDPLATLKDIMNKEGRGIPEPRLINETGRNTILAAYEVAVYSDKQFLGSGAAESISIATGLAAHDALRRLFKTTENMSPFSFKLNPYTNSILPNSQNVSISN